MFKRKRVRFVKVDEFNERMAYCKKYTVIHLIKPGPNDKIGRYNSYLEQRLTTAILTYNSEEGITSYILRLDNEDMVQTITGVDAFAIMSRYYKVPRYPNIKFSARALLWKNDKYEGVRHHVYYYDLNSAYATIMANYKFPDTSVKPQSKVVSEGEIGFTERGDLVHPGDYAFCVFPLMESPFKRFAETWYKRRKTNKKAKNVLCYSVGYLQRVNPFLRAYIINSCNEYIKSLIDDESTIYCNTDCIVSLKPLPELSIGDKLGEWKYKEGEFAYFGLNYQFNNETPVWRGIPKGWWKNHPDFDILRDTPPSFGNVYRIDLNTFKVVYEKEHN